MADQEWKVLDLHRASFDAVSKAQGRYVHTLLIYLVVVWGWEKLERSTEFKISLAGVDVPSKAIWPVTPLVVTILLLGLIGAMNVAGPIWARLSIAATAAQYRGYFTDFDVHRNILDYFVFLTPRLESPVQGSDPAREVHRIHNPLVFSYSVLIVWAIATTFHARWFLPRSCWHRLYLYGCLAIQVLFSTRIFWQAICRFFGIRESNVPPHSP